MHYTHNNRIQYTVWLITLAFSSCGNSFCETQLIGLPENYILEKLSQQSKFGMARYNVINIAQAGTNLNFSYCTKPILFQICFLRNQREQGQGGSI